MSRRSQGFGRCGAVRSDATPTRQKLLSSGENLDLSTGELERLAHRDVVVDDEHYWRHAEPAVQLASLATRHALPTIYHARAYAEAGGLMSYGTSLT